MFRSAVEARSPIVAADVPSPGTEVFAPTAGMACCVSVRVLGTETATLRAGRRSGFGRGIKPTAPIDCGTESVVLTESVSATFVAWISEMSGSWDADITRLAHRRVTNKCRKWPTVFFKCGNSHVPKRGVVSRHFAYCAMIINSAR